MQAYIYRLHIYRQHKHIAIQKEYKILAKLKKIYHVKKVEKHSVKVMESFPILGVLKVIFQNLSIFGQYLN